MDSLKINKQMSNLKFVRAMFTSNGMELRDMGQKVLWAERRSRRGWPRPARSTTGYALCSFLNMADARQVRCRRLISPRLGTRRVYSR